MPDNDIPQSLAPGTSLQNGAFVLNNALGRGGFGITYAARDVRLDRDVAIKEFFPEGSSREGNEVAPGSASDTDFRAALDSFEGEARTLARFQHPNIVDVYTVFEENRTAYMVMEFLRGASLQQIVDERGALPPEEAVALIEPICDALETVHGAGLLHGDITPSNIMRTESGRVALLDFGLTKRLASNSFATMRLANTRLGTAGYAPLEQYGRQTVPGISSDVYSLAATLYFLLSGEVPTEAIDRASGIALPALREVNPNVREDLSRAVEKGLALEASARPQSAREWCESLQIEEAEPEPLPIQAVQRQTQNQEESGQWQRVETYAPREQEQLQYDPLIDLLLGGASQHLPQRIPQPAPQNAPRRRQNNDPFRVESGSSFVVPGCTSGCSVGCIILMFVVFMLLSFLGSFFQPILFVLGF